MDNIELTDKETKTPRKPPEQPTMKKLTKEELAYHLIASCPIGAHAVRFPIYNKDKSIRINISRINKQTISNFHANIRHQVNRCNIDKTGDIREMLALLLFFEAHYMEENKSK